MSAAQEKLTKIGSMADRARTDTAQLRDPVNQWLTLASLCAWALLLGLILYLLARTGLLSLLRGIILRVVPSSIPPAVRSEAKLTAEAFHKEDPSDPATLVPKEMGEATAARRVDPVFNAAFIAEQKKLKENS